MIETPSQTDIIFNENLTAELQQAVSKLQQLIGTYSLYRKEGSSVSEYDDDQNVVAEEYMQKLVYENFYQVRETLSEALQCEDYEEEGILELSQLIEAIMTTNEELETSILDYMLFYVYVRSKNYEKLQYKNLIDLLDTLIE